MSPHIASIEQIAEFDTIIDVRSPSEFEEDHLSGALNYPVLNDEERARVGTLHKQNAFEARRLGAALISQNIATFLQNDWVKYDRSWRPLVYCKGGRQRSGAVVTILSEIGWCACRLQGGYKAYRQQILTELERLPKTLNFKVLSGPTGTGKSRLLQILSAQGHQVLDLEQLAQHRGSLLGQIPQKKQPAQRFFDSCLYEELKKFTADKPVYIESESRRIGLITLPLALYEKMHSSPCIQLEVPLQERIRFLMEDYQFYLEDRTLLKEKLLKLSPYKPKAEIQHWLSLAQGGENELEQLVRELLENYYDPHYWKSLKRNFEQLGDATQLELNFLQKEDLLQWIKERF